MAIDTATPRTRRALLAAALGAGAATVASALGRPLPARAADGDPVLLGATNTASAVTEITNTSGGYALSADAIGVRYLNATSPDSVAIKAQGLIAIEGSSTTGNGVQGHSDSSTGIWGTSGSMTQPAILGSSNHVGVSGTSGGDGGVGVYGYAVKDSASRGVLGRSTLGQGVRGMATKGSGVYGYAISGTGVFGYATQGTAVRAESFDLKRGYALRALGRVRFDQCAGVATIAAGTGSVTVTPGTDLTNNSAVVATLNGNPGGSTTVARAIANASTNQFTIYLTADSTTDVKVAWHVFG